jgi:hypothetical protein
MSRSFVHVLLSLLLLLTQQMSLKHAASHLAEACSPQGTQAAGQEERDAGGKPALRHLCALCLDGAQLAFSLPASTHGFVPPALADDSPTGILRTGIHPQPLHVFHPRGPPQA